MNMLGKIFVVLILLMSVVFMTAAMAVYAAHKNWETEANKLDKQVQALKSEKEALVAERNRMERQLKGDLIIYTQRLSQAETHRDELINTKKELQTELDTALNQQRTAIAAAESTQANNTEIVKRNETLLAQLHKEQAERDKAFAAAKTALDDFHGTLGELMQAKERVDALVQDTAKYRLALRAAGKNPDSLPASIVPRVSGEILSVSNTNAEHLIEISIGSDDGLKRGHTVEVYRGRRYLGRAEIVNTAPDKSVGKIIPRTLNGRIEEGDRVATKLRV